MIPIPPSRPKTPLSIVHTAALHEWKKLHTEPLPEFYVLAVRSHFDTTIAPPGPNINADDDAFFVVSPLGFFSFNGNVEPTRYGWNPNANKYMARLKDGCWRFIHRLHRGQYWAFGQGENPVTVERIRKDGTIAMTETGCFGIDLHPHGENSTSSEGCITIPQHQWGDAYKKIRNAMRGMGVETFDLILTTGPIV